MNARIHHISILNRFIQPTFDFYHNILGLKLLMKTINQDDHTMYHLFFSDNQERIGTELTFFEVREGEDHKFGTNNIERVVMKVPSEESLTFWEARLEAAGICHYGIETFNGRPLLRFEAPDDTQMSLTPLREFEKAADFYPFADTDVPVEHAILGIDAIQLRGQYPAATEKELTNLLGWHQQKQTTFFDTNTEVTILDNQETTFYQEVHLIHDIHSPLAELGIGGIHHVAFGVKDEKRLRELDEQLNQRNFLNSGIKHREFFTSLYFREPNRMLIEIATEEGSLDPSAYENQSRIFEDIPLYLPHFLAGERESIEQILENQPHDHDA